ncbi:MAG: rRNA maturation RNase YbeY [Patescibacteria group bacterium]
MDSAFTLLNKTKGKLPSLPFADMKTAILGNGYELSLVFVSEKEMHEINMKSRGKDKPTNILSFPLDAHTGEIFICPTYSKKEAPDFDRTYENYLAFLFIHGLVHLKGFDHGSRMEAEEEKFRTLFGI